MSAPPRPQSRSGSPRGTATAKRARLGGSIAIAAGFAIVWLAQVNGPLAGPPLYDGVVVSDPYLYLAPLPGQNGGASGANVSLPVAGGTSPGIAIATPEEPPQAQLVAAPGALNLPRGTTGITVSITPVAPSSLPPDGQLVGNDYAIGVTNQAGAAIPVDTGTVTVILRAPVGAADATMWQLTVDGWRPLTTYAQAVSLRVASTAGLGEFALVVPEPSVADIFRWSLDPSIQVPLILSALAYVWAVRRVDRRRRSRPVPRGRAAAFLAGLATIELATQGIVGQYDGILFSDHMVQHLLLMMVAAPLLVMGAPVTLALRVAGRPFRARVLLPLLHARVVRFLAHPVVASVLFAGVLWGSHFSAIYELSLENATIHDVEHLVYLVAALLFWWPMLGADPAPQRIPYPVRLLILLFQMIQGSLLGVAILSAPKPLYAHYAGLQLGYTTPLADQQAAGAIMWVFGGLAFVIAAMVVIYQWMQAEEAATVRLDARLDRERRAAEVRERPG